MDVRILTHSGGEYVATVVHFDATQLNEKLNDINVNTVAIGDVILSRIDVKLVVPISE